MFLNNLLSPNQKYWTRIELLWTCRDRNGYYEALAHSGSNLLILIPTSSTNLLNFVLFTQKAMWKKKEIKSDKTNMKYTSKTNFIFIVIVLFQL